MSGVGMSDIMALAPKYGIGTWDMNSIFILMVPAYMSPILFFRAYRGLGEWLTAFTEMFGQLGTLPSGLINYAQSNPRCLPCRL